MPTCLTNRVTVGMIADIDNTASDIVRSDARATCKLHPGTTTTVSAFHYVSQQPTSVIWRANTGLPMSILTNQPHLSACLPSLLILITGRATYHHWLGL